MERQSSSPRDRDDGHRVQAILEDLDALGHSAEPLRVHHITERFAGRSYGPFLLVPALLELSPVGAIPTVPTMLSIFVGIVAIQLVIGRSHVTLPGFIACRTVPRKRVRQAKDKLHGLARFLDRHFHGRFERAIAPPMPQVAGAVILCLCLMVPPLELLPFASMLPMAAVAAMGLALLVRDGLLMIASLLLSGGAIVGGVMLVGSLASALLAG